MKAALTLASRLGHEAVVGMFAEQLRLLEARIVAATGRAEGSEHG